MNTVEAESIVAWPNIDDAVAANDQDARDVLRSRILVEQSNINPETFLATDYLNHFNEIEMLVELVPGMPDCFADVVGWNPKSYPDHFRDSNFSDKELAVEAYELSPAPVRQEFEQVVAQLNDLVLNGIRSLKECLDADDIFALEAICQRMTSDMRGLIDHISAIIHGSGANGQQAVVPDSGLENTQSTIDDLFAG